MFEALSDSIVKETPSKFQQFFGAKDKIYVTKFQRHWIDNSLVWYNKKTGKHISPVSKTHEKINAAVIIREIAENKS